MLVLTLSSLALAGTLTLTGECGGPVAIEVVGLTPGGTYALLTADNPGSTTLGGGPCAGTTLGLESPFTLRKTGQASAAGELSLSPNLPAPNTCGLAMQVVDAATCTPTNVAIIPGGDADGDGFYGAQDCDDNDANVYPGAPEICDGKRTDCDDAGWTGDDGLATWIADDGTITDYSAALAAPGDLILPVGGSLMVCPGTWEATWRTADFSSQDVAIIGVGGPEVTRMAPPGVAVLRIQHGGAMHLRGLTIEATETIFWPGDLNSRLEQVRFVRPDGGRATLLIAEGAGAGPGTLIIDDVVGTDLQADLDVAGTSMVVTNTDIGSTRLNCTVPGIAVSLTNHTNTGYPSPSTPLQVSRCDLSLDTVDIAGGGFATISANTQTAITANDLTVTGGGYGLYLSGSSSLDGTNVTIEATGSPVYMFNGDFNRDDPSNQLLLRDATITGGSSFSFIRDSEVELIDTLVELGGGLRIEEATVTCRKVAAATAGVVSHNPQGASLISGIVGRDPAVLISEGCDWLNATDVDLRDVGDAYNFGPDASFTCSTSRDPYLGPVGSCL